MLIFLKYKLNLFLRGEDGALQKIFYEEMENNLRLVSRGQMPRRDRRDYAIIWTEWIKTAPQPFHHFSIHKHAEIIWDRYKNRPLKK